MNAAPKLAILAALPVLALALALASLAARQTPGSLARADKHYAEKSYAEALKTYEQLVKEDSVPRARRDDVAYRICVSLGKTKQWDRALEESLAFVQAHQKTVWEPRGLYWLGRLYIAVPHNGWRVGKKLYRGQNVPKTDAHEKPEQVYLYPQDYQNARDAFEAARVFYPAFREASKTEDEEIQLNYDLARTLNQDPRYIRWLQAKKWEPPSSPVWKIDTAAPYDPSWPAPKKRMFLFEQTRMLAGADRERAHQGALALFGKALWLRQYHQTMQYAAQKWDGKKQVRIPYPYQDAKWEEPLRQIVRNYPDDPVRDQAQYTIAMFLFQSGKYVEAKRECERLLAERPKSKWTEDARALIANIVRRELSVQAPSVLTGQPVRLTASTRNIRRVRYEIFRFDLPEAVARLEQRNNVNEYFQNFRDLLGRLPDARRFYGARIASFERVTKDRGDYRPVADTLALPVKESGAYIVEASTPEVKTTAILLISDMAMAQKMHRDGALCFVTDARSGAPVAEAKVVTKIRWYEGNKEYSAFTRGQTGADGLLTVPLPRKPGRTNFRLQTLAYQGDRYALVGETWLNEYGDNPGMVKVYTTTDRAVYRPQQTVNYRHLVMRRLGGEWQPLAGQNVHVSVHNPKGEVVHEADAQTSGFGSVNGSFRLASGAPLGEYHVMVNAPALSQAGSFQSGGERFRVEEYKKPEFEVTVEPEAERVRLGKVTTAKVVAKYYFGGPVPGAKVTYRVYRNYWAQSYRFPRPFDFLYRNWNEGDYSSYYRNGEVLAQGEARTDAKGEARIPIDTSAKGSRWQNTDLSYTIEADVQDSSRRVITGTGAVKATRHDVAVFLDFPHGYATQGDRVDVEVRTVNPSDRPVSVSGTAKVYRQPEHPNEKEQAVWEQSLRTDAEGRADIRWTAEKAGYYRLAFETLDSEEQPVSGSVHVWVNGPELARGRFLFQNVFLAMENSYYQEGLTAKALLITPEPGCTVLLTREADNEIVDKRVIRVAGRSMEIQVPITRRDVPNVYISAVLIRNGQMYRAVQEVFVPPARQFASVTVQADRTRYQPGEKAMLTLAAKDWQGRPLRTELAVSVSDAALAYIQKDYAPDIRAFFYGDRRSQSIENLTSNAYGFNGDLLDNQGQTRYRTHEWVLPEGMGMLPDWPGKENQEYRWNLGRDDLQSVMAPMGRAYGGGAFGGMGGRGEALYEMDTGAGLPGMAGASPLAGPGGPPAREMARKAGVAGKPEGAPEGPAARTRFEDTAFWTPAVVTDAEGKASVEVTWPDNLTQWRAQAVGATETAQVGSGEARVTTRKDLLVRLQAPRFFVERDLITLSANVHNYQEQAARVHVKLDLGGDTAELLPAQTASTGPAAFASTPAETWVDVPKDGEKRVDWTVRVRREGALKVRMSAEGPSASDAMEMTFPVLVHGVERQTAHGGVMRQEMQAQLTVDLPEARKPGSSALVVQLTPSLGGVMLDALPYLADYPYGCIEQTMSRFLPSVVVADTLRKAGYDLQDLERRAKLLEERAKQGGGSRPMENSPYTYPQGVPGSINIQQMASSMWHTDRWRGPVFDRATLDAMVTEGMQNIRAWQHEDGGWGWWPADSSDPYMTAYVIYGLMTARDAGYRVDDGSLARGLDYLKVRLLEDDNFHRMAWLARVLVMDPRHRDAVRPLVTGRMYENRERLSAYSKALLAMALHDLGDREKAGVLLRNFETTAQVDEANGTASWEGSDGGWWRWWNNKVETNAAVLQAYMKVRSDSPLAPMVVKWLVNNRRGNSWYSTKETAMAVYALADYVGVNKELNPEYTLTVDLGGRVQRKYTVTKENALFFDNTFIVPDELLKTGPQSLTITKSGPGALYYAAYTRYFSLEEPIKATGNEIYVTRRYFRLLPGTASGQPVATRIEIDRPNPFLTRRYELLEQGGEWTGWQDTQEGPRYERAALRDGETVISGDLLEVELQLESKNDYDYLVFEDLKPAGCEPVEIRSGGHGGLGIWSNMELRDQKVAFFLSSLPQGRRTLTYRMRAEIPGRFHVLPTNGYAMYAPDIRALSDEAGISVQDAPGG